MRDDSQGLAEFDPPFDVFAPAGVTVPVVLNSPHSGAHYPQAFLAASALDALTLRRSEDAFVDQLFAPAATRGAPLLRARFPRAFLDLNREPFELDPQMFEGRLPDFANTRSLRVAAGLGVIPRVVGDAQPIYREPMSVEAALRRIAALHRPYHAATRRIARRPRSGDSRLAMLLDCHSMPSTLARRQRLRHRARRPLRLQRGALGGRRGGGVAARAPAWWCAATSPMPAATSPSTTARPPLAGTRCRSRSTAALYMDERTLRLTDGAAALSRALSAMVGAFVRQSAAKCRTRAGRRNDRPQCGPQEKGGRPKAA